MFRQYLLDIGLLQTEVDKLTDKECIQYLRFHHKKEWATSNILFLGFIEDEERSLNYIANKAELKVKKQLGNNLSFICISKTTNPKKIEKASIYNATIIDKDNFEIIFDNSGYDLYNNEMLYDLSIPESFRITKPLHNFNQDSEVESFSYDSENKYLANLYQTTCTCKDFEKKIRRQYPKGDIRRLCKHLMDVYKNSFGTTGLSELNKFIINEGYPVKKIFYSFSLPGIPKVIVNYDSKDDWWNIFIQENGSVRRYGYSPIEKRFANNEKPIGSVPALRLKLEELKKRISSNVISGITKKEGVKTPKGCLVIVIVAVIFISVLVYTFCNNYFTKAFTFNTVLVDTPVILPISRMVKPFLNPLMI